MMRPWLIAPAWLFASFLALSPTSARADLPFDQITVSHPAADTTVFRIAQPNVKRQKSPYPGIRFHPGDEIVVTAGGCAQTGGYGRTWKSYTNPQGDSADVYYSGTIYIPGVVPLGPDGGYARVGGWTGKVLRVPADLPPTIKAAQLILNLGYQDNNYSDNGYWSHDDGNNDQCKNVGPAFVVVKVVSHPAAPVAQFTPWSKPFDVTWKPDDIDANGLPLNPFWAGQIDPNGPQHGDPATQLPDFVNDCGGAFSWNWGRHGMDEDLSVLKAKCTSQAPTTDFDQSASVEPCCYCHPQPLSGHLDWLYATFSGTLFWEDYSGGWPNDGDYNLQLVSTGSAGLTDQNGDGVELEFQDSETVDNFTSSFWQAIRNDAENTGDGANIAERLGGKFAMATGLVVIDGVHGGYTEVHPVMALAICIKGCTVMQSDDPQTPVIYGADQTWVFFIQNYGRGGNCSSSEHVWPGLPDGGDASKAWYFLSLPWHPGATAVSLTSQDIKAPAAFPSTAPARWKDWTFFGFQLPVPTDSAGTEVDGEVTIHYTLPRPPPNRRTAKLPGSVRGHVEEGGEWKDLVAGVTNPDVRGRLEALVRATPPIRARPRPHMVSLALSHDPRALQALAAITPDRARRPTRDRPFLDTARLRQEEAFFKNVVTLAPLRPRPGVLSSLP